jgi:hypothetical protein
MAKRTPRDTLGPHWARRLNATLDALIDAEPVLHEVTKSGSLSRSLTEVCDALREVLQERRY